MKIINNTTEKLADDLRVTIKKRSRVSMAAACFSVYAFEELKAQLENLDELRFIHEYVVLYAKSNGNLLNKISAHINERDYKNPDNDPRGPYKTMPCTNKGGAIYSVMTPSGKTITEEWRFKRETYDRLLNDNRLVFPRDGDGKPR